MNTQTNNWYNELIDTIEGYKEAWMLPEDCASDLRYFALNLAREQYKAGFRSGASVAKTQ